MLLPCKTDCNFDQLLVNNFTSDVLNFSMIVIPLLTSSASKFCKASFSKYLENNAVSASAIEITKDLSLINLLSPTSFKNFSANDAMQVASALTNNTLSISKTMAQAIGNLIPSNQSAVDFLSIASAIPIQCFFNSDPLQIANNAQKIDVQNMQTSKKSMIALSVNSFII